MTKETGKSNKLKKEMKEFDQYLLDMDYGKRARKQYTLTIKRLGLYMLECNLKHYSHGVGEAFFETFNNSGKVHAWFD